MTHAGQDSKNDDTIQPEARGGRHWGVWLLGAVLFGLGLFIVWGIIRAAFPPRPPLQGQMEARTISVSSRVPGRVAHVLVDEGESVKAQQVVAILDLPELDARLEQAISQEDMARAKESMVEEGARPEQKRAARAEWERVQAEANLALTTYRRLAAVYRSGLISKERFDEARTKWIAAAQAAEAARQEYDLTVAGSREQEKAAAADVSNEAASGVKEVSALVANSRFVAPRAGEIEHVVLTEGEIAAPGYPVVTLVDLDDQWATFNILEKDMPGIELGKILEARVPAVGQNTVRFKVYYISPRASYATWRSTRDDSGYDMKTFQIRARPAETIHGLRPGMSVLVYQ